MEVLFFFKYCIWSFEKLKLFQLSRFERRRAPSKWWDQADRPSKWARGLDFNWLKIEDRWKNSKDCQWLAWYLVSLYPCEIGQRQAITLRFLEECDHSPRQCCRYERYHFHCLTYDIDDEELLRCITPNEKEDFLLLSKKGMTLRTFTNSARGKGD